MQRMHSNHRVRICSVSIKPSGTKISKIYLKSVSVDKLPLTYMSILIQGAVCEVCRIPRSHSPVLVPGLRDLTILNIMLMSARTFYVEVDLLEKATTLSFGHIRAEEFCRLGKDLGVLWWRHGFRFQFTKAELIFYVFNGLGVYMRELITSCWQGWIGI